MLKLLAPAICLWIALPNVVARPADYNPLQTQDDKVDSITLEFNDASRDRTIPLRVYLPVSEVPAPVVLFSHGLGGSRDNNGYLGRHLAARGYLAVFLQHPGSDTAVWQSAPLWKRMSELRKAASFENLVLRCQDVHRTLDQLNTWNASSGHLLASRMNLEQIGMCGHSFGAYTTQYVSGQTLPLPTKISCDERIDAAIAYSPSAPRLGSGQRAFRNVDIPWMLMTGTHDSSPIGGQSAESRLQVFPDLPNTIDRFELVLHNAEHSAFSDRALPGDQLKRNPNHHRAILAFSTAFWDSYLKMNNQAKLWLTGDHAKQLLEADDKWQFSLKH